MDVATEVETSNVAPGPQTPNDSGKEIEIGNSKLNKEDKISSSIPTIEEKSSPDSSSLYKQNKHELSITLRKQLENLPEILEFIKKLQKCIEKQKKKIKKLKSKEKEKIGTKSVGTQTEYDSKRTVTLIEAKPKSDVAKSVTEEITEAAQQALQKNGFVYEETSGLYYDYNSGYYYNAEYGLYYDGNSGNYLQYNQETKEYVFHSKTELPVRNTEQKESEEKHKHERTDKGTRRKRNKSSQDEHHDGEHIKRKKKVIDEKSAEREDGECSDQEHDNSTSTSLSTDENSTDLDYAKQWPPCMRIIIEETAIPSLKQGSLHILTFEGGSIGREGAHSILLPEINNSKHHVKIAFDSDKGAYFVTDLGSRNGTYLNGKRLASAKVESDPHEIVHGSRLQIGSSVLLCHVHTGTQTCGHCEPGLLQMQVKDSKDGDTRTIVTKSDNHKFELKQLRKKFGLGTYCDQGKTNPGAGYTDRAQVRREKVGSQNPHEKTQSASLHESIASNNKGFKLLSKMGWKEGQALGKDNQGRTEPVELISNPGTSGMGISTDSVVIQPLPDMSTTSQKQTRLNMKQKVWRKTQLRYEQVGNLTESDDIFDFSEV